MVDISRLRRFLKPTSVAIIGGSWCDEVVRQCQKINFQGPIWPVNPKRDDLAGVPCFKSLDDLPGVPDAVFVGVNHTATIETVAKLSAMGVGGAVCFASGYAEVGDDGKARQQALVEAAGEMPIQGPNCYGLLNLLDGVALWPDQHGAIPTEKGVAILSQSGNIGINVTMQQRGLPLAYMAALGNQAQCGVAEFIDAMLSDDRVNAIGLLIEGLPDVARFTAAARRALEKGVPIVALKSGRSEAGAAITVSHTSTLAGADHLYDALFERYGIARVDTLPVFLETLKLLSLAGPLTGNKIVSMSCSGGEASMIADLAETRDLDFAPFSDDALARVEATTHELVHVSNPFDYHTFDWGKQEPLTKTFTEVAKSGFDARVLVYDWPRGDRCSIETWMPGFEAFKTAHQAAPGVSIMVTSLQESVPTFAIDEAVAAGIVPMFGFDETLKALEAAARIGAAFRAAQAGGLPPVMATAGELDGEASVVDEAESKARLKAHGVPVPDGRVVDADGAAVAAAEIGFPVVLKALGSHMTHKSDVGGVALNLTDEDAVEAAVAKMAGLSERFLVERMEPGALAEMIVGVSRDPQFGLTLVVGAGGVLVELVQDSAAMVFPVSRDDVARAIGRLKISRLLDGYRGKPAADLDSLISAILAVAAFAEANADNLVELDVNPLLVFEDRVVAVDALLRAV